MPDINLPKKDRFLTFFFIFLAVLILTLVGVLISLHYISGKEQEAAHERYESYVLATLIRQTSDDLTKMARLYVMTGDQKYRDHYNEILCIREGKCPRPLHYHEIYWDLVIDDVRPRPSGPHQSLNNLLIMHGFTLSEFEFLREAEEKSNQLTSLENSAMNRVADHPSTEELDKVQKLLFSSEYMHAKAEIMAPIQKFYESITKRTYQQQSYYNSLMNGVIIGSIALAILSAIIMVVSIIKALASLSQATKANELLLLNILPGSIAMRLKKGEEMIADEIPQASVLFTDIVHFTEMTYKFGGPKMVGLLNRLFAHFDELTEKYGVEKVKTIGDNYMVVAGVPNPAPDHAIRLASFAIATKEILKKFNAETGMNFTMRTGMTYGSVVAGVIGHKRFIYDVWGDVVNTASRMESTCPPSEIQITEKMAHMLEDEFVLEAREEIDIKGKGLMKTYFLKGKKERISPKKNTPS